MSDDRQEELEAEEEAPPPDQAPPQEPKPPKKKPITVSEMADVVVVEAMRREGSQIAIVKAFGAQHEPSEKAKREVEVLHACALFLDRLIPHMDEIRRLLKPRNETKPRNAKR